jgi:hypothetical protein
MAGKSKSTLAVNAPLSALAGRLRGGRVIGEAAPVPRPCTLCDTPAGATCRHGIVTDGGSSAVDFGYVQIHRIGCLAIVIRPYAGDSAGTTGAELIALARMVPAIGAHGERDFAIESIDMVAGDDIDEADAAEIQADAFSAADAEMQRAARAYAEAR